MAYNDRNRHPDDRLRLQPDRDERDYDGYGPGESGYSSPYRHTMADPYGRDHPSRRREGWSAGETGFTDAGYGDGGERERPYRSRADRYDRSGYRGSENRSYAPGWAADRGFVDRASDEIASWFGDEQAERRREMDQNRGKGPRGYKRTDARILEDVNDRLSEDAAVDASDIEVQVVEGDVTLSGEVANRYEKRRAEDIADSISGVVNVQNNIRVKRPDTRTVSGLGASSL
ncbi:BON domain-containing protein [Allorhizobium undicola]|uniref:BON domain-containing protein n=1 Tax=Allorhizobium undicola TaxID=78527 RepID=UPI0006846876|nr:BON domain-containing protein [Allorhizobium undicola]